MKHRSHLFSELDALEAIQRLSPKEQFDLVYLDPPYGVGTIMTARSVAGETRGRRTRLSGPHAYDDRYSTDLLLGMLAPRLAALPAKMSRGACLYLHLDHRAVHEAKRLCDDIFGPGSYIGEVIWVPGNGGRRKGGFSVTHQTILIYVRSPGERKDVTFNAKHPLLREPYAARSLEMHFRHRDADGRRYRERTLGGRTYRYYEDEGRQLGSVWTDIPAMTANTPLSGEATGYPTQKPIRLLERIIVASSREGDTVADLMCGSGTTLVAAARQKRRFVGNDASPVAAEVVRRRLAEEHIKFEDVRGEPLLRRGRRVAG